MLDENEIQNEPQPRIPDEVEKEIGRREARKLKRQSERPKHVWFGLGMFGLVGWSVAIPTLIGAAIGMQLDAWLGDQRSWTLMLLLLGLFVGCVTAWRWLKEESEVGQ